MMVLLQTVAGMVMALGVVAGVFWFTFRDPPPRRPSDSTTAIDPNTDAGYLIRNSQADGHGGCGA